MRNSWFTVSSGLPNPKSKSEGGKKTQIVIRKKKKKTNCILTTKLHLETNVKCRYWLKKARAFKR